jgi:acetyltransferase-like isoleucine patch superfamily enzyme
MKKNIFIHHSADVSESAEIGTGCKIWHQAQIREQARLGANVIVGKNAYIGCKVKIGNNVKIQNNASVYQGVTVEDGVFVGPHVCFTNDRYPRATDANGELKTDMDWRIEETLVRRGASIGAGTVVLPGVTIGAFSMVGSGSLVTVDVPDHGLVVGSPARKIGYVCTCGRRLIEKENEYSCPSCRRVIAVQKE